MRSMVSAVFVVIVLLGVPFAILDAKFVTRAEQDTLNQEVQRIGDPDRRAADGRASRHATRCSSDLRPAAAPRITFPPRSIGLRCTSVRRSPTSRTSSEVYQGREGETGGGQRVVDAGHRTDPAATAAAGRRPRGRARRRGGGGVPAGAAASRGRFGELASTAERLGAGDQRPRHRRYGIAELDRIAEVIDHSAERVSRMLAEGAPARRRRLAPAAHPADRAVDAAGGDQRGRATWRRSRRRRRSRSPRSSG